MPNGAGGRRRRGAPDAEERLDLLDEALDTLKERVNEEGVPALVEGDKDEAALRNLGVTGPIVKVHSGQPLFTFAEGLARAHAAAVLLVDWDRTGGTLARRLREACQANGVDLDDSLRLAFMRATRGEVRTVESLDTYVRNLEGTVNAGAPPAPDVNRLRRLAREEARRHRQDADGDAGPDRHT